MPPRVTRISSSYLCPRCQQAADLSPENPDRPFCSKRCRMIDLGAWAAEEYQVPGPPALDEFDLEEMEAQENAEDGGPVH